MFFYDGQVQQLADEVKVRWNDADLPPGFWNSKTQASLGKDRMASIEASPISPTLQLLADMDEKKRRDQAKKTNTSGAASTDAKQEIKNLS